MTITADIVKTGFAFTRSYPQPHLLPKTVRLPRVAAEKLAEDPNYWLQALDLMSKDIEEALNKDPGTV